MNLKFLITTLLIVFICHGSFAQLQLDNKTETSPAGASNTIGHNLLELVKAMKPTVFSASFIKEKKQFLSSAQLISAPSELSSSLQKLITGIKPDKIKPGFNKTQYLKSSSAITSMQSAKEQLLTLEKNLNPKSYSNIWVMQRSNWINKVSSLK